MTKSTERSSRRSITFTQPSMTKQSFRDECDINNIMSKFEKTGLIEHQNRFKGDYGDFVDVRDYQASLDQVIAAEEMFDALPSKVRLQFDNDPSQFLAYAQDSKNHQGMIDLGLVKPDPEVVSEVPKTDPKSEKKAD